MYSKKLYYKIIILLVGIIITGTILYLSKSLVDSLKKEERKKIELWAEAMEKLSKANPDEDISFLFNIIKNNETVPVIVTDEKDNIITFRNIDTTNQNPTKKLLNELKRMKKSYQPIEIHLGNSKQYVYYRDSILLDKMNYFPLVFLTIILIYIVVSYIAFSSFRKAEQNFLWMGMAKETAHQLGTPISSLTAIIELIKNKNFSDQLIDELESDVARLSKIAERFSKIGSRPTLENTNLKDIITKTIDYLQPRMPASINIILNIPNNIYVTINKTLFEWVFENLIKNAVDAMNGKGTITISAHKQNKKIIIDISDTGKGIPRSKYKTIFKPGYTTKQRGWGLGLTFVKRIIEVYHKGKIFVKSSKIGEGTTLRIIL
ncbi:MAG: HAMP domain-containing histidine kinase [Bacteroidales bacterium]|nr:HAMP domain-containing histidine kinase [Bacteroidales bacterium]